MTLADLVDRIDWSDADEALEKWAAGSLPVSPRNARATLLDGALNLMGCVKCPWKGIRDTSWEPYVKCPMCNSALRDEWEGRLWARAVLGDAWKQAEEILKAEGLAK